MDSKTEALMAKIESLSSVCNGLERVATSLRAERDTAIAELGQQAEALDVMSRIARRFRSERNLYRAVLDRIAKGADIMLVRELAVAAIAETDRKRNAVVKREQEG